MIRSSKCLIQLKSIFGMEMIKCRRKKREKKKTQERLKSSSTFSSVLITNTNSECTIRNRKLHMLPTNYPSINRFFFFLRSFVKTAYLPEENWPITRLSNVLNTLSILSALSYLYTNKRKQSYVLFFFSIISLKDDLLITSIISIQMKSDEALGYLRNTYIYVYTQLTSSLG
jgi:hypothetical protein